MLESVSDLPGSTGVTYSPFFRYPVIFSLHLPQKLYEFKQLNGKKDHNLLKSQLCVWCSTRCFRRLVLRNQTSSVLLILSQGSPSEWSED